MKKLVLLLAVGVSLWACKNEKRSNIENPQNEFSETDTTVVDIDTKAEANEVNTTTSKTFPLELKSVFAAHGGLNTWKKMNNLCFRMKGKNGVEVHTISLPNRKNKIETKDWSIGNDANGVWLLRHDLAYEGNPVFYHNLMFYFYAMPFVISDPGINYSAVGPTVLDGETYNGFKISYNKGVGDSPEDEYILYFDPTTNKMAWLAYTVTFKEQKKSDDWHFIKYDKWQEVNGLLLPKKLVWYEVEDGKPTDKKMVVKFDNVSITETMLEASVFKKPSEGRYVN
ncbi:MAG: hypothetical protein CL526_10155 [Aequorivita sp.]|nr:hypothetical protein [Aequorivita sp.]|tara:strand:- start:68202 stop:69050 length:849 start_codon:yes stop_codon:yes gene_type:complete